LGRVRASASIAEISKADFVANLDALLAIYCIAMGASRSEQAGRLAVMERHASNPGFAALAATPDEGPLADGAPIVAFAYAFHGTPGQWWHDVVRAGLSVAAGTTAANGWLADPVEIAEVHVHPSYQNRGIGRRMMLMLAEGRPERTAVLSTQDNNSPAKGLYQSLGFAHLLTGFRFPGSSQPYAVMGATLPLQNGQRPGSQTSS
jgi:GNAT superfamily N-acetyltransferase